MTTPLLQIKNKKLRLEEVESLTPGHTARKSDLNLAVELHGLCA